MKRGSSAVMQSWPISYETLGYTHSVRYQAKLSVGLVALLFGACGNDGGTQDCNETEECYVPTADAGVGSEDPADRRPCEQPFGPVGESALLVDSTYTGGDSDGSSERPFTSIQNAVDAASTGQEIGIASGTYTEDVSIESAVHLEGRCANDVIVEGRIHVQNTGGVAIRGLTVRAGTPGILVDNVQPTGDDEFGLRVRFVRATENIGAGLEMNASGVKITDSEFSQTLDIDGGDIRQLGSGLFINNGSFFDVGASVISMNGFMGIDVADATGQPLPIIEQGPFKATATSPSSGVISMNGIIGNKGGGMRIGGAPSGIIAPADAPLIEILGNEFANNDADAIQIFSARTNIMANGLRGASGAKAGIRGEAITGMIANNQIDGFPKGGIDLSQSQELAIDNNTLTDNIDIGIISFNNLDISLSGNLIRGTRNSPDGMATGHGIYIASDGNPSNVGTHELTDNNVSDNQGVGIFVSNLDLGDTAEQLVTMNKNTIARNALMGIDLDKTRAVGMFENEIIDNVGYGLRCIDGPGATSRVFFDDNTVMGTKASGSGLDGDAIVAANCHISVDLNTIQENARNGVVLVSGTDGGCVDNDVTGHDANGVGVFDIRVTASPQMGFSGNTDAVQGSAPNNNDLNLNRTGVPGI